MTSYAGFDTSQCPSPVLRARLKAETALVWCVAYLVAPSHPSASWSGQHAALRAEGWGLLPVYVGQETVGPGSHNVTPQQGSIDGSDCAAHLFTEGYAPHSRVALDLENGPPYNNLEAGYVEAWASTVRASDYVPCVYCSHAMVDAVVGRDASLPIYTFKVPTTAETTASIADLASSPDLSDLGIGAAFAWQFRQNVMLSDYGLLVDLDVADRADPGAPLLDSEGNPINA